MYLTGKKKFYKMLNYLIEIMCTPEKTEVLCLEKGVSRNTNAFSAKSMTSLTK